MPRKTPSVFVAVRDLSEIQVRKICVAAIPCAAAVLLYAPRKTPREKALHRKAEFVMKTMMGDYWPQ